MGFEEYWVIGGVIVAVAFGIAMFICYYRGTGKNKGFSKKGLRKYRWILREDFEKEKRKMHTQFSELEFDNFFYFLKNYGGGYVRRSYGKIVYQDYLPREKGDLKGIFYRLVVPNHNINSAKKEEFRKYLISIGVTGVENRPEYETRAAKLVNRETEEQNYIRKEVGNLGEELARAELSKLIPLGYKVINGPRLKWNKKVHEYDHILIGNNGVFCVETKAFGMTDGKDTVTKLLISSSDQWTIKKGEKIRQVKSPTSQILAEKLHLEEILLKKFIPVNPVLLLCNRKLTVDQREELLYPVIKIDGIVEYIHNFKGHITETDKEYILRAIDGSRVD